MSKNVYIQDISKTAYTTDRKESTMATNTNTDLELTTCAHCGATIDPDAPDVETADGDYYCNASCITAAGFELCDHCGEWIAPGDADAVHVGNNVFCNYECAHEAGFEQCENCGEWVDADYAAMPRTLSGDIIGVYCSDDCASSAGFTQCDDCGEWVSNDEATTTHDGRDICEDCYDCHYHYCENCGEVYHDDEGGYCGDYFYCTDCMPEDESNELHEYGYTPFLTFFGENPSGELPYFGVELETDTSEYDVRAAYVSDLVQLPKAEAFWLTQDGSLNNGVEVTSMPCTLDYHVSSGLWEAVRDTATAHGYRSHDTSTCGLHIHVNRAFFGKSALVQDAAAYKLTRLMQRFERQLTTFARRIDNHWCAYGTTTDYAKAPAKNDSLLSKAADLKYYHAHTHAKALNLQHSQTFEFRIFKGTLRVETLYASLALINGLAHIVKAHGETWCEHVTWYDLMAAVVDANDNETARNCLTAYLTNKGLN